MENSSAEEQLASFLAKYPPEIQAQAAVVLAKMRRRFPNAVELVYDYNHALVCNFGPTEKGYEGIFSVVFDPRYIRLYFVQGADMPDPHGLLQGRGKEVRWIRLSAPEDLDCPEIVETMEFAIDCAKVPCDPDQPYRLVIKSKSAKQRSRQPR